MKKLNRLLAIIAGSSLLVSCADEFNSDFKVDKPESIAQYEYLNAYGNLKSYINRTNDPNFKLGAALAADDFLKKELVYSLTCANFDEMTAGNEMKHASCVNDKGEMDFSKVTKFVETAKAAGLTVYGHTLCWHAQQNNTYLNGLIAPTVIPGEVTSGGYCMVLKNATAGANNWSAQTWYQFATPLTQGVQYTFTCKIKATEAYNESIFLQSSTGGAQGYPGGFNITTEWTDVSLSFTPAHNQVDKLTFNFGDFAGKIYVDDVKITADGSNVNLFPNSDFEAANINGWTGWTPGAYEEVSADGEGYSVGGPSSGGYNLNFTNSTAQANNWQAQAWYLFSTPLIQGTKYTFTCMIKGTAAYSESIFLQSSTGGAQGYPGGFPVTTEWSEVSLNFTPAHGTIDKFTFNFGDFAGTISIDNVKLTAEGSSTNLIPNGDFEAAHINGWTSWSGYQSLSADGDGYVEGGGGDQIIEKTPEEKKTILSNALETWIKGMMEACKGNVKSWDVVNEPMSDGNPSELKSDPAHTDTKNFYWQDYIGKDYARYAIKYARQYGGNDLKLFINDYNLEAAYNNNAKCDGLIKMIEYWESDGVTKVDGIGSQMHVTYNLNPQEQAKQEAAVVKMLQLLAASGKLIKISELDMGIFDNANNVNIKTADVTYDQLVLMSKFYQFIIDKYFEIIPASQRYGITQWCITDSPEKSGWREGEPVGLWTLDYNRKPCYEGFVDGLK